jgi:cephalosporin hydroxylase
VISIAMPILNPVLDAPAALADIEMEMIPEHVKYPFLEQLYNRVGHVVHDTMLELIGHGEVVAVDIDIREHNRKEIEQHPMFKRITMIEGGSTDREVFAGIKKMAEGKKTVMVVLDSNHTHQHVYDELRLYADLVSVGSYLILPDTLIEFFPIGYYSNRPWDVGDNPYTAMKQFLAERDDFKIDDEPCHKSMITEAIDGYLVRTK